MCGCYFNRLPMCHLCVLPGQLEACFLTDGSVPREQERNAYSTEDRVDYRDSVILFGSNDAELLTNTAMDLF